MTWTVLEFLAEGKLSRVCSSFRRNCVLYKTFLYELRRFQKAYWTWQNEWSTVCAFHKRVIPVSGTSRYSLNIHERMLNNNRALNLFFVNCRTTQILNFFGTCKSRAWDLQLVIVAVWIDRRLLIVLNIMLLLCNDIRYPTNRVGHKIIHSC